MTNEQINNEIAKICEWGGKETVRISSNAIWVTHCPDYCTDLNAMHEAEKWLTELNWFTYISELAQIVRFPKQPEVQLRQSIHATARQRAEAFLRTLGKWEEVQA